MEDKKKCLLQMGQLQLYSKDLSLLFIYDKIKKWSTISDRVSLILTFRKS